MLFYVLLLKLISIFQFIYYIIYYNIFEQGLVTTVFGTFAFAFMAVYNKQTLLHHSNDIDKLSLIYWSNWVALLTLIPLWLIIESHKISLDFSTFLKSFYILALNGVSHFLQSVGSVSVLDQTTPLTFSISNVLKRIVIIFGSILYFRNSISFLSKIGMIIAFTGSFLYIKETNGEKIVTETKHDIEADRNVKTLI